MWLKRVRAVMVQNIKEMTIDQPAPSFLYKLNRVKRVRGCAEHAGDDQPAPSFLHE
jgi:hypothetical protein